MMVDNGDISFYLGVYLSFFGVPYRIAGGLILILTSYRGTLYLPRVFLGGGKGLAKFSQKNIMVYV